MHIGIFGHYGNQNLGDEAIIEATIASVRRHFGDPQISCFSVVPEDTQARHGVPSYPITLRDGGAGSDRDGGSGPAAAPQPAADANPPVSTEAETRPGLRQMIKSNPVLGPLYRALSRCAAFVRVLRVEIPFMRRCREVLKPMDLLIVAGSNQFLDNFGGVTGFPLNLLKWSVLCKLSGTRLAFVSVGAGPIHSPLSKILIRMSLWFADYVSYRDTASRELIEGKRRRPKGGVFPDLASNLDFPTGHGVREPAERPTVGINPMPMYDSRYWHEANAEKYRTYVTKLAELATRLLKDGFPIFFFGTQAKDYNVIDDVLPLLPAGYREDAATDLVRHASSVQELMGNITAADIVVATRFHGTVLSLAAGVPVFGICYYRKAADLLRETGQGDYFVLLEEFDVDRACDKFGALVSNLAQERRKIEEASRVNRERIEQQYRALAGKFARPPVSIRRAEQGTGDLDPRHRLSPDDR